MVRREEREQYLKFVDPAYYNIESSASFYKLRENNLVVREHSQLSQYMIGVLRGGAYFSAFDKDENINKSGIALHRKTN